MGRKKTKYTSKEFRETFVQKGNKLIEKQEKDEQIELSLWIKRTYPFARVKGDLAGAYLHKSQRSEYNASSHTGHPDTVVYNPMLGYIGLALELKRSGVKIRTMKGDLRKSDHLAAQAEYLAWLAKCGWCATFAVGLKEAKEIINLYFSKGIVVELREKLQKICFPILPHLGNRYAVSYSASWKSVCGKDQPHLGNRYAEEEEI